MEQRSNEWYNHRIGKFTASEIHKLMGIKGLGETGKSYCFEKACEIVYGIDEDNNLETPDMKRGILLEPLAFRKFKELKYDEFIEVEKCGFFKFCNNSGASPDGLVDDDGVLEIKCPRPNKFFKIVKDGIDAIDKEYLFQIQKQLLATKRQKAYFFNYLIYNGREMYHEIVIQRDEKVIELMKERIKEAVIIRDLYIAQLKEKQQFI